MIVRFCGYTTLRNLRFFEPFFVLYLLLGLDLSYVAIGGLLAYEKVLTGVLEAPLGVITDRWGRRRGVIAMFLLSGLAFVVFALSARSEHPLIWLGVGQTLLGVGESLRTGTHKAIMLDWLSLRKIEDRSTSVIGLTRVFSKTSLGVGAMVGGLVVWQMSSFVPLFWAAAVPCGLGAGLLWTYPRVLEGEWVRDTRRAKAWALKSKAQRAGTDSEGSEESDVGDAPRSEPWWPRFRRILSSPGIVALLVASILFETQIKMALIYLQPYLAEGFEHQGLAVIGGLGAVAIGSYYLVQGIAAGASSLLSGPMEKRMGGREPVLRLVYLVTAVCFVAVAACLWFEVLWPGAVGLLVLACLQNLRRPVFVSRLSELMDPYQRGTTLSIESQARNWMYAVFALVTGALADSGGLGAVFTLLALVVCVGMIGQWLTRPSLAQRGFAS